MSSSEQSRELVRKSGPAEWRAGSAGRRTRKQLHDAFIALVIEKGYEKTTIRTSSSGRRRRSTFYVHYRDKEALLMASSIRWAISSSTSSPHRLGDPIDVTLPAALLFEHAYRNQRVYRRCATSGRRVGQRHLRQLIGDVLAKASAVQRTRSGAGCPPTSRPSSHVCRVGPAGVWIDQDFRGTMPGSPCSTETRRPDR